MNVDFCKKQVEIKMEVNEALVKEAPEVVVSCIEPQSIDVEFCKPSFNASLGLPVIRENGIDIDDADLYDGTYVVTPAANRDQILPTKNKILLEDVTVLKVPYYETSNISGNTVYIASEVI